MRNTFGRNLSEYLKAVSQSFFFRNASFGACLLGALLIFDPMLFSCGLLGSLVGYIHSVRHSTPKLLRSAGLIPVNGLFFGFAAKALFEPSMEFWACLLVGAALLPYLVRAAFEICQHWKMSPLILPYILGIWLLLLAAQPALLKPSSAFLVSTFELSSHLSPGWAWIDRLLRATFEGTARLILSPDPYLGMTILVLISLFSPRRGLFFLVGTMVAALVARLITGNAPGWENGLFSYSAGLVGLGLASLPERLPAQRILLYCGFSALLSLALNRFMGASELPLLTLPYVLTLWLAHLSQIPRLSVSWSSPRLSGSLEHDEAPGPSNPCFLGALKSVATAHDLRE